MSIHNPRLRSPLKQARGLGSAKNGLDHWIVQRITAAALLVLVPWFVWFVLSLLHADYATVHAAVARPVNAVPLMLFLAIAFWHAPLGLQVVIEDYIHVTWQTFGLTVLARFLCIAAGLASIFAVARIAFAGG